MALLHSEMVPLGTPAHSFKLHGIDGRIYSLDFFKNKKVLAVIFMCNHCPYVQATIDRLVAVQKDYQSKEVQLVGINPNDVATHPEDSFPNMKLFSREHGMNFPYLQDETQEVAHKYNAVCTPDIFVYGPDRRLAYRGRIDDNWQEPHKVRRKDLRDALNTLIAGEPAPAEQHPSMGCSIKWKR
ncbi:MAG: thioredoxin family protein [Nitrospirae bacterium]|nr:thioredoxin family protein [Nitrospirota bacterium]